jgi:hypothetical protein
MAVDHEGMNLPNIDAARMEAVLGLRQIIAEKVKDGLMTRSECIIIANKCGRCIEMITFYDALAMVK